MVDGSNKKIVDAIFSYFDSKRQIESAADNRRHSFNDKIEFELLARRYFEETCSICIHQSVCKLCPCLGCSEFIDKRSIMEVESFTTEKKESCYE